MAINLPTDDPVTLHCPTYSNGRLLVVYNSDVAYSLRLAQRYARRKLIPTANLYGIAMGTDQDTWDPGTNTVLVGVVEDLVDALDAIECQGILLAPGVPRRFIVQHFSNGSSGGYVADSPGTVPITGIFGAPHSWLYRIGNVIGGGDADDVVWTSGAAVGVLSTHHTNPLAGFAVGVGGPAGWYGYRAGITANSPSAVYDVQYEGLHSEVVRIPSDDLLDYLGTVDGALGTRSMPVGRIGYDWDDINSYSNSDPPGERFYQTEVSAQRMMEQGLRYSEACSPGNRYRSPIHIQFAGFSQTYCSSLAYLHSQLLGWGYQSSYFCRQAEPAWQTPYTPLSGSAYTIANLNAGKVRDVPYHLMLGDASNDEMVNEPYVSAWKPTGGGGCLLGPSEGWQYSLSGLLDRGAAAGVSHSYHITTDTYVGMYTLAHLLLRGMDWLRANYFSAAAGVAGFIFPCGDPLARPFPR